MNKQLLLLFLIAVGLALVVYAVNASPTASLSGVVVDENSDPVAGAAVRVRATDNVTTTTSDGQFILAGLVEGQEVEVTAWADGYYIASAHITPTIAGLTLTLRPYHTTDHPDYEWVEPSTCDGCHPMLTPQWIGNAHGNAVSNPRFFSLYNGTDITGTVVISPGYKLDFPGTAGNCANCHAPGAGVDGFATTDMNLARGVVTAGIHCDYCHKIGGVYLNPATGSVYPNAPGVLSQRMLRPPAGDDIFFGPYDDIHDPDTYLPVITQSQYCAPCHQFSFWGTPIYESYNEWLNSSYAEAGVTCQACHMPPNGDTYFALPEQGGLWHPAENIPSHLDLGLKDTAFMTGTVAMSATARTVGNSLVVTVTLTNTGAGHHVPTDHPGRHLILMVSAVDGSSLPLPQTGGKIVPDWGGAQAGMPGKVFAKVLEDALTHESPVVSYWKQTFILSDNRIPALGSDTSVYQFTAPPDGGEITISAELLFRRNLQAELDTRGWDSPDILMQEVRIQLHVQAYFQAFLPIIAAGSSTCPQGKIARAWTESKKASYPLFHHIQFKSSDCHPCPVRNRCTKSQRGVRSLDILPRPQHEALQKARQEQKTAEFWKKYAKRSGIEGTLSQGVRAFDLRCSRYIGLVKTGLQMMLTTLAMNIYRLFYWLAEYPLSTTRTSHFARLAPASVSVSRSWRAG